MMDASESGHHLDQAMPVAPDSVNAGVISEKATVVNGQDTNSTSLGGPPMSSDPDLALTNGHVEKSTAPPMSNGDMASITPVDVPSSAVDLDPRPPPLADPIGTAIPMAKQPALDMQEARIAAASDAAVAEQLPAVLQQPTSDLREHVQPADPERTAEIIEQKEQQDLRTDPDLANGTESLATSQPATLSTTAEAANSAAQEEPPIAPSPSLGTVEPITTDASMETANPTDPSTATSFGAVPDPTLGSAPSDLPTETPVDPAPTPVPQAESIAASAPTLAATSGEGDIAMPDAPKSPAKVARDREDDELESGPSAKRAKTEEEPSAADFKVPELPPVANGTQTEEPAPAIPVSPMTRPQQKHLLKIIGNVKRTANAKMFAVPVDYVALNLPSYPTIVTRPMDLRTLEENLRADQYDTAVAAIADFNRIYENSRLFNGDAHPVTQQGALMKASFDKGMHNFPGPDVSEVAAGDRKKKAVGPTHVTIPNRRQSRTSLPGSARSPPSSAISPQTTFAKDPLTNTPLTRRDSTLDGRPKREIHRPPPRDLPYSGQKPKKKKYQWELKFCEKVAHEMVKPKYLKWNYYFLAPVDPVALNIPDYFGKIKKPMDLGTINKNIENGNYENAREFEQDVRQVFQNCYTYNPPGDIIWSAGKELENLFDTEWSKKREWIENNAPASLPQSPGSSPDPEDSDEEEEDEEEEEDDDDQAELRVLQKQIAAMSKQVQKLEEKKKQSPPVPGKKGAKGSKTAKKESKKAAPSAPVKASKKAATKSKKDVRIPQVSYEEKQDISNRINSLSEDKMNQALGIIRNNMPNLKGMNDDELELDIDELSNEVLYKLLQFVRKHAPRVQDSPVRPAPASSASAAAPSRKKNKPMSKHEQESRIASVQQSLAAYQSGQPNSYSQGSPPQGAEDDDADSEDDESSEEE